MAGFGCQRAEPRPAVTLYTYLTESVVAPALNQFHAATQIDVAVELLPRLTLEEAPLKRQFFDAQGHPRCDVLWDDNLLPTLLLERQGAFEPYQPTQAQLFSRFSSPQHTWHGFSGRARVLLVNKDKVAEDARPKGIRDLTDAKWQGRVGLSTPLRGTSAAQAAALFATWEAAQAEDFYRQLKQQARILDSEQQAAAQVAAGELDFALTNSDAAMAEIDRNQPVVIVYPDQEENGLGTFAVPGTLAVFKDCAHPQPARDLIEFLLTPVTEEQLAGGPTALVALSGRANEHSRLPGIQGVRPMHVDYSRLAAAWDEAAKFLEAEFGVGKQGGVVGQGSARQ